MMPRWISMGTIAVSLVACGQTPPDGTATGGTAGSSGAGSPGGSGGSGSPTGGTAGAGVTGGTSPGGTGNGGSAGAGAVAGSGVTGGSAGDGGSGNAGSGAGGTSGTGTGGTAGSGGGGPMTACTFTVNASPSAMIPTVGIVEWSTDLASPTEARIEFGRDTNYGMVAPVELPAGMQRTLLLGMKPTTEYHFRIVAANASGECVGSDNTIMTGARASGLPNISVTTPMPDALYGGFLITGHYSQGGQGAGAYIVDADGDFVWWYRTGTDVTGARMSYDGKYMWINAANVPGPSNQRVMRVSMDGMTAENLSSEFPGQNHQMTVLPDESVAFYAYGNNGCDDVKLRSPSGQVRTIINAADAHGAGGPCHLNAIEYSPMDETLVFSDLDNDNYTKVTLDGEVVWVLGGSTSDFTGDGSSWNNQHGVDVLGLDRLLIFNNGQGTANPSLAIEILLDLGANTATRAWSYNAMPPIANAIMGDVQRLENGNTAVAYSTAGVLIEVNPQGQVVQEMEWPLNGVYGYIQKRKTLYGPPPR